MLFKVVSFDFSHRHAFGPKKWELLEGPNNKKRASFSGGPVEKGVRFRLLALFGDLVDFCEGGIS